MRKALCRLTEICDIGWCRDEMLSLELMDRRSMQYKLKLSELTVSAKYFPPFVDERNRFAKAAQSCRPSLAGKCSAYVIYVHTSIFRQASKHPVRYTDPLSS